MVYGGVSRAVKTLRAVSASHLPVFPPTQASKSSFDPQTWGQLQPPPSTALSAFAHRIGLGAVLTDTDDILKACTHPSILSLSPSPSSSSQPIETNAHLSTLGNALMGLFATEYVNATYPYLPTRVLKAAVTAHVGPQSCANAALEMGAVPLLRWAPKASSSSAVSWTPQTPAVQRTDALASIPRALTALIYHHRSLPSARQFVHSYFLLSRQVDVRSMIKFVDPKKALKEMVAKFGRDPPKSRLLKETGRFSNSPVFVVGIYSGEDKLGEGFGASLKMAEYRAAEASLLAVYLTRRPPDDLNLPTDTFPRGLGDVFAEDAHNEGDYLPPDLPHAEVMYASGGRSGRIASEAS